MSLLARGQELMIDCSSIDGVDEVRCASGQCVVGKFRVLFLQMNNADAQTHARGASLPLVVFASLEVFSSSRQTGWSKGTFRVARMIQDIRERVREYTVASERYSMI